MIRRCLLAILLVSFVLSGCAYYNTFFNARKYYDDAEEARAGTPEEKRGKIGLDLYEKAMKKCAKVIVEHPDSKWVDDAVLLMGKCMYAKGDYLAALRKFDEIASYYGNTKIAEEARFFKAKTYVALDRYGEAVSVLEAYRNSPNLGWKREADFLYARVQYEQGNYEEAARGFESFLKEEGNTDNADRARVFLGASYREAGNYAAARDAYERRLDNPVLLPTERFRTSLDLADLLIDEGRYEETYEFLQTVRSEVSSRIDSMQVDHRWGQALIAEGRLQEVVTLYEESLDGSPSAPVAGEMAYELGEIYLYEYGRKDSAASAFRKVATYQAEPETKVKASRLTAALGEQSILLSKLAEGVLDSAEAEFLLAENSFFEFGEIDSAFPRYDRVARDYPESELAPKALAAKAYLMKLRDDDEGARVSTVRDLIRRYPRSEAAIEHFDRGDVEVSEDSLAFWRAAWDEIHESRQDSIAEEAYEEYGRIRVFPGEGEIEVFREGQTVPILGPPGPLRLESRVEADYPLFNEGSPTPSGEVDVEVEVGGGGRVRDAWIIRSSSPEFEGPALAAAYQCRYVADGALEPRKATLRFRFSPGP